MNIRDELQKYINSRKYEKNFNEEQVSLEFLNTIDFSEKRNVEQGYNYIKEILKTVEKNEPISRAQAKSIHFITTKISLATLSLNNLPIIYRNRNPNELKTGAYYSNSDKSIVFFNEDVCNER